MRDKYLTIRTDPQFRNILNELKSVTGGNTTTTVIISVLYAKALLKALEKYPGKGHPEEAIQIFDNFAVSLQADLERLRNNDSSIPLVPMISLIRLTSGKV